MILDSFQYSFLMVENVRGGGAIKHWVGFENYYNAFFVDPKFVETLGSGVKQLFFDVPAILIFSLFMAVLLNQKMIGRAAFRAIFFIPVILSTGLIADIDAGNALTNMMGQEGGAIDTGAGSSAAAEIVSAADLQNLFNNMVVGSELAAYVTDMVNNIFDIVNRSGVQMLIFLAGLQSVPQSFFEASRVEGATKWEEFWFITFPMLSNVTLLVVVYTMVELFVSNKNVVVAHVYNLMRAAVYDQTSAMMWFYFLICGGVMGIVVFLYNRFLIKRWE